MNGFSRLRFSVYAKDLSAAIYELSREKNSMNIRLRELAESRHITPLPSAPIVQSAEKPNMSVTGIQNGAFEAKLAEMRKKLSDRLTQGLTKIDTAAEAGAARMEAAVDGIVAKVEKEIDDKLQEFATMSNGGPA